MLKRNLAASFPFILLFLSGSLSCVKDHCTQTYQYFVPVYKTTEQVRANIKSNAPITIESAGKLYVRGRYILLNEIDKGIHIIDNANPSSPQNVAFIDIPGNMDMAVKGNTLYADAYTDLVTIDISDPLHAKLTAVVEGTFPFRQYYGGFYPDTSKVIVDWVKRDTTINIDCGNGGFFGIDFNKHEVFMYNDVAALANSSSYLFNSSSPTKSSVSPLGVGGSMARFAIAQNYLYTVTTSDLNVFGINNPQSPSFSNKVSIGQNIETIYPFKQKLFIGSSTGMFIYNISDGAHPQKEGLFAHVQSCDPVIADDKYAYSTLRTGTTCNGVNQLDILDISDINNPTQVKSYSMTNPYGLSKDGNLLFICDGRSGLKVYDASDVRNIIPLSVVSDIETFDVIAMNGIALVVTSKGLYQYSYADPVNPVLLSKMEITI
ncbi:MAG: hypothetical protein JST63_20565 [Bacteroidetes bacterium]|nr:hypothetical protein [Bacteroidota bacterium]